jgi:hypothetical protein
MAEAKPGVLVYVAFVRIEQLPIGVFDDIVLAIRAVTSHSDYEKGKGYLAFHIINGGPVLDGL